jgi:hypothetical protein
VKALPNFSDKIILKFDVFPPPPTPIATKAISISFFSSSSVGTTTPVGFRPAQLSLSILSRKVLESAVASGTSNHQLGGEISISLVLEKMKISIPTNTQLT